MINMQDHILNYIKQQVIGKSGAALLIGNNSAQELKELYQNLDKLKYRGMIEKRENETKFWTDLLGLIKKQDFSKSNLTRDQTVGLVETSLKRLDDIFYLFLPDVDTIFYKYDVQEKGMMGASLRRIWQTRGTNLTILGSLSDANTKSYETTIDKYTYPFYLGNWLPIFL